VPNTNKAQTGKEAVHRKKMEQKEWYHVAKMNAATSLGPFMNEEVELIENNRISQIQWQG
jgi:hypothetical protein